MSLASSLNSSIGDVHIGRFAVLFLDGNFHLVILLFLNKRWAKTPGPNWAALRKSKSTRTAQSYSGAGIDNMGRQETTIFVNRVGDAAAGLGLV